MPPVSSAPGHILHGELCASRENLPVQIHSAGAHTLLVQFTGGETPGNRAEFDGLTLRLEERELSLGRCRYLAHAERPARRASDPVPVGHGRIVFLDQLYDFSALSRTGAVSELRRRMDQLPLLWERKKEIRPAFRELVAETLFDLQVFRGLLDEIDRSLAEEPVEVRDHIQAVVAESEYPRFVELFDAKLAALERTVADFSQEEHERHGFYLRKHAWDLIRASEFMLRTNLKPRGYPGDSEMMRMIYEEGFSGPTLFSRFMHRHPLQSAAAQAVRNRVALVTERLGARLSGSAADAKLRVMSVASGPAWELQQVFALPAAARRLEVTLLDQDAQAHTEAQARVLGLAEVLGQPLQVRSIQDSVRTMLRTPDLSHRWGRFDFLYSMGLFDYLTAPVAKVVLSRLYDLLAPGGELVVGNFHVRNATRIYLEYWMDWVLLHRTETDLLELAAELPFAQAEVVFEQTGSQSFLVLRKADA